MQAQGRQVQASLVVVVALEVRPHGALLCSMVSAGQRDRVERLSGGCRAGGHAETCEGQHSRRPVVGKAQRAITAGCTLLATIPTAAAAASAAAAVIAACAIGRLLLQEAGVSWLRRLGLRGAVLGQGELRSRC